MLNEVVEQQTVPECFGEGPALADWLVALSHDSPFERPRAGAPGTGRSLPLTAVPSLLSLLPDADPRIRLRVVAALGALAEEIDRVLPAIRAALGEAALHDTDDGVRAEAARALLRAGPQSATAVSALVDALRSALDVVRVHAATALGGLGSGGRAAVPALIHASLWDKEPAVRVAAAVALRKIDDRNDPLVVRLLTEALEDANELICWVAVECLGQMGPAAGDAVPALRRTLQRDFRLALIKTGVQLAIERIAPRTE
jgi:HEAT repeat protein